MKIEVGDLPGGDGSAAPSLRRPDAERRRPRRGHSTRQAVGAAVRRVVRRYLASLPQEQTGWLAGLRDPVVAGPFLAPRPVSEAWTAEALAREVNMSRSPSRPLHIRHRPAPMRYLAAGGCSWRETTWRRLAGRSLRSPLSGLRVRSRLQPRLPSRLRTSAAHGEGRPWRSARQARVSIKNSALDHSAMSPQGAGFGPG